MGPTFFRQMRHKGRDGTDKNAKGFHLRAVSGFIFRKRVGEFINLRDRCVKAERVNPSCDFIQRLMGKFAKFQRAVFSVTCNMCWAVLRLYITDQRPDFIGKSPCANHTRFCPFNIAFGRAVRQHKPTGNIGPIAFDNIIRVNDITFGFGHFNNVAFFNVFTRRDMDQIPVFICDIGGENIACFLVLILWVEINGVGHHALSEQAFERLSAWQVKQAAIPQAAREKSCI